MNMSFSIRTIKAIRVRKLQEFGFESCFGLLLEARGSLTAILGTENNFKRFNNAMVIRIRLR